MAVSAAKSALNCREDWPFDGAKPRVMVPVLLLDVVGGDATAMLIGVEGAEDVTVLGFAALGAATTDDALPAVAFPFPPPGTPGF